MSWSTTPGSARVLVSPNSLSCLDAILRRILLIIFPLLVFGSPGAQCILSGAANAPIYQCHNLYEQFNRSGWQVWVGLGQIWLVKVTSGSGCFGFKISVQSSFQVHNFTSRNSRWVGYISQSITSLIIYGLLEIWRSLILVACMVQVLSQFSGLFRYKFERVDQVFWVKLILAATDLTIEKLLSNFWEMLKKSWKIEVPGYEQLKLGFCEVLHCKELLPSMSQKHISLGLSPKSCSTIKFSNKQNIKTV